MSEKEEIDQVAEPKNNESEPFEPLTDRQLQESINSTLIVIKNILIFWTVVSAVLGLAYALMLNGPL